MTLYNISVFYELDMSNPYTSISRSIDSYLTFYTEAGETYQTITDLLLTFGYIALIVRPEVCGGVAGLCGVGVQCARGGGDAGVVVSCMVRVGGEMGLGTGT